MSISSGFNFEDACTYLIRSGTILFSPIAFSARSDASWSRRSDELSALINVGIDDRSAIIPRERAAWRRNGKPPSSIWSLFMLIISQRIGRDSAHLCLPSHHIIWYLIPISLLSFSFLIAFLGDWKWFTSTKASAGLRAQNCFSSTKTVEVFCYALLMVSLYASFNPA